MEVLFSFGTWERYPFQRGYIIINAANRQAAVDEFRRRFPDNSPHTLNCADVYTDEATISDFKGSGNLGKGCHLYVDLINGFTRLPAEAPELKGWIWKQYDDGSGHLESPDGKDYFGYDISSQEFKKLNDQWDFMPNYPSETPFKDFKAFAEKLMVDSNALWLEMVEAQEEWNRMNEHLENGGDIADFDPDHIADWAKISSSNEKNISATDKHNTVVVNLFAGPGAGKTPCAWEIAAELKKVGLVVEYVSEVAKEYVWDGNSSFLDGSLEHQKQLYEAQNHRVQRLMGKVDVIVTDSPILLNLLYLKEYNPSFEEFVIAQFKSQRNFNLFVKRGNRFEKEGRIHNLNQSIGIDNAVIDLLRDNNLYYGTYSYTEMQQCVKNIQTTVSKAKSTVRNKKSKNNLIM